MPPRDTSEIHPGKDPSGILIGGPSENSLRVPSWIPSEVPSGVSLGTSPGVSSEIPPGDPSEIPGICSRIPPEISSEIPLGNTSGCLEIFFFRDSFRRTPEKD